MKVNEKTSGPKSDYTFLWRDSQPPITIQTNINSFKNYSNITWNQVNNIIEVSEKNNISCYHSTKDLDNDVERGKLYFDKDYPKQMIKNLEKVYKEYQELYGEFRETDYLKLSNNELYGLFVKVLDLWSHIISYFRATQAEGTYHIIEELKKYVSNEEASLLITPLKLDDLDKEQIDWQKIIKKPLSKKKM